MLTARGGVATCKQAFRLVKLVENGLQGKPAATPPEYGGMAYDHKLRRPDGLLACGYCSLRGSAAKSFQTSIGLFAAEIGWDFAPRRGVPCEYAVMTRMVA